MADAAHTEYGTGRFGRAEGAPGLIVQQYTSFSLASVIARKGQAALVATAAQHAFGVTPTAAAKAVHGNAVTFLWSGPGHWLVLGPQSSQSVEARLGNVFGTQASVFDQGGSRVLLELGGPRVRDVLAKGIPVDLHPRSFRTGDVAVTTASHLAVHLWQVSDQPVYRLLVVHTYFDSLWRWLAASAAACGCEVLAPAPYPSHPT